MAEDNETSTVLEKRKALFTASLHSMYAVAYLQVVVYTKFIVQKNESKWPIARILSVAVPLVLGQCMDRKQTPSL